MVSLHLVVAAALFVSSYAAILNFEELGGIPHDRSYDTAYKNGQLMNNTFNNLIQPGDTFIIPNKTFALTGGIYVRELHDFTWVIDGTLSISDDRDQWPRLENGDVMECFLFTNLINVTFTSTGKGTIDGNGQKWWGAVDFLRFQEDRPRIIHILQSENMVVEHLFLKDSPYWTFWAENCEGMIVRYVDVSARWTDADTHTLLDLQAFNTDGIDVTGNNVHIHDCYIWNQDDCVAVKDGSSNMLIERVTCSGLGLVIGSIGDSQVSNITFRDCYMPNTFKGIYMKVRWSDAAPKDMNTDPTAAYIRDVTYENIVMDNPEQFAIWIGPAQQTGQPCSLAWPLLDRATCDVTGYNTWENIILRNITINNPLNSPGVIMGNATNIMRNVRFEDVVVNGDIPLDPFGEGYYECHNIDGYAVGSTYPVPPCFTKEVA